MLCIDIIEKKLTKVKKKRAKRHTFLKISRSSPLTSYDSLIYSRLIYELRYGRGSNKHKIITGTGLDRKTVSKHLDKLQTLGLVSKVKNEYFAEQPKEEQLAWFRLKQEDKRTNNWLNNFAFIYIENNPQLTVNQNLLFAFIESCQAFARRKRRLPSPKGPCYYSLCLGINRKTVSKDIQALKDLGLIEQIEGEKPYTLRTTPQNKPQAKPAEVKPQAPVKAPVIQEQAKPQPKPAEPQVEPVEAPVSQDKPVDDWSKEDPWLEIERNQTPEEKAKADAARRQEWVDQELKAIHKLWNSYKIDIRDQKELAGMLWDIWRETGVDAVYETLLSGSLYRYSEKYWLRAKAEAKSNPRKYFKTLMLNLIRQSYGYSP